MNEKIYSVLMKLEKQSQLEKKKFKKSKYKMQAITYNTGKFLNILLKSINAKNILEIGLSTGYSTLWFVDAILHNDKKNGKIITIENNSDKIQIALNNFHNAFIFDNIKIIHDDALHALKKLKHNNIRKFDFIFIDADKENIKQYFDFALKMLRVNGIIVTDNILYPKKYLPIMKEYIKYIKSFHSVYTVTVPIGNGEEITVKIK